jgi:uncharacterized protein
LAHFLARAMSRRPNPPRGGKRRRYASNDSTAGLPTHGKGAYNHPLVRNLDSISLKDSDRRAILAAAAILRKNFPVEQVILFGSKARGQDNADSDIDLLILTRDNLSWQERDRLIDSLFDIQLQWNVLITPLVTSVEQWEAGAYQVLPIRDEIERDGIAA